MSIHAPQKAIVAEVPGLAYYTEAPALPPVQTPRVARKLSVLEQMYAYYTPE